MFNFLKKKPEEKWIWVEGYKGTDENMCCEPLLGTKFQYELNKTFACDGTIIECNNGFHFCEDLQDVFGYYQLNLDLNSKNRFFKIKGLVNKKDYDNMKALKETPSSFPYMGRGITTYYDSKLVAKEIILKEELTYNDLKKYISLQYSMIKNEEDYNICIESSYTTFIKNKFLNEMKKLEFSDIYSQIQYDCIPNKNLFKYLKQAEAYKTENISKDLLIYLLEQYKKTLN